MSVKENAEGEEQNRSANARKIRLHELILQTAGEGIYGIDERARTIFVNPAAAHLLGEDESNLIGRTVYETLFGAAHEPENFALSPIGFALVEGEPVHISEETFYRRDGSTFLVEYMCAPIREEGKVAGAVITFQDISERRDIQQAISEARDRALENARLKTAFVANISHEIRTPLNGIVGISQMLAGTALDTAQREYLDLIIQSANTLSSVVNDVLDFSKIESGSLKLEKIAFNIKDLTSQTVNLFAVQAERKNVRISFETNISDEDECLGDAFRIRQLLNNLIGNAVKFTPAGGKIDVVLSESAALTADHKAVFRWEIRDTGIGIAPEVLPTLFQPFIQADVSTSRRFGGTGLGLAISRDLTNLMDGEIGAESKPQKGSTFWFTLPLSKQKNVQAAKPPVKAEIKNERRPRVLIVDDNEINRLVTAAAARELGAETFAVADGAEALQKHGAENFEMILMDCQMPLLDGYETTRRIRQNQAENESYVPIIALTAHVGDLEKQCCRDAGMDDFLTKPLTTEHLKTIFEKYLPRAAGLQKLDVNKAFGQHHWADIIEAETLRQLTDIERGGEANFIEQLLENYLQHADMLIAAINNARQTENASEICRAAHQLCGSSASIGLKNLQKIFDIVENEALNGKLSNIGAHIADAETALQEVKDKFKILSETSPPASEPF